MIILWHVSHQASPCGIPAKWIGPLWRSQSSCVMNTDEGCCWHCENQRQHTRLAQTTPRPRTTALHEPTYTTTCSRWEEHGTGLWLRERERDRHTERKTERKREESIWMRIHSKCFWTWYKHGCTMLFFFLFIFFTWNRGYIPGSIFCGIYHVHHHLKVLGQ